MKLAWRSGVPIFWQTLAFMCGFMLLVYVITALMIYTQWNNDPNFIGMAEIANRLEGNPSSTADQHADPAALAVISLVAVPPSLQEDMIERPNLTRNLAQRMSVNPGEVRLYFPPNQRRFSPFDDPGKSDLVPVWRGEALFFDGVIAARRTEAGWRVLTMPRSSRLDEWERRLTLMPLIMMLVLVTTAFVFARRLSRPLRRFAEGAERLGRLHHATPLPIRGPSELRTAALAINAMQQRIEGMIRERTEMVAAIAHDLRTPLARIAFRVESAPEGVRDPVLDDIDELHEMIASTLDFARVDADAIQFEPCDLTVIVEELAGRVREMGQFIAVETAPGTLVAGDRLMLKRMIQNLIENSFKYASETEVHLSLTGNAVVLEIADRGPGLPEDMLERITAPFVRREPSRSRETGGAGLGLAISKAIAARHGGSLTLRNRPNGGLIAQVRLPQGS